MILKERIFRELRGERLTEREYKMVEESLDLKLPIGFKDLNRAVSYEYSKIFSFLYFGDFSSDGLIQTTLGVRKRYPKLDKYVVLYLDDAGIILLDTKDEDGRVIWCSVYDLENLSEEKALEHNPIIFSTFAAFFEYLLDEEEKMRSEG
jgi:hypothetical protein